MNVPGLIESLNLIPSSFRYSSPAAVAAAAAAGVVSAVGGSVARQIASSTTCSMVIFSAIAFKSLKVPSSIASDLNSNGFAAPPSKLTVAYIHASESAAMIPLFAIQHYVHIYTNYYNHLLTFLFTMDQIYIAVIHQVTLFAFFLLGTYAWKRAKTP